jgi:soluble lytic murein transglycosylase-like protein
MRSLRFFLLSMFIAWGCLASPASASVAHTVQPGETLWSIAAASNFTTRALAAANGLPETAGVTTGTTIQIPSVGEAAAALSGAPAAATPAQAPPPMGAYTVRPGDSLSAIAVRSGVPMRALAYMNGLDPHEALLTGTVVKLPTGAAATRTTPLSAPRVVPRANPAPTPGRVTAPQIGQIAAEHGVPPALAASIAWQESGFNNSMVSSANARGVMQIMPGTWDWVQHQLAPGPLDPASPNDNVKAGVLYLGSLLRSTGGDSGLAAGAYYQGLGSVRRIGLLPETRRYVNNVQALQSRFGGP